MKNVVVSMLMAVCLVTLLVFSNGCRKPYQEEKYEEVKSYETAFVIPLEDATGKQVKFDSINSVEKMQVASKRIPIPTRWKQTARMSWVGEWIDTVIIIKVDRSPVTREWTSDANSGTSNKDQGIWAESSDSVGFSTGFNCTAKVEERNAAKFLYNYPNASLANIMDNQIRAEIQATAAFVAAKYPMDSLRDKKNEIIEEVKKRIVPFFEETGITIMTVGMFGGFTYENPEVQKSIDNVFIAQQLKQTAKAKLDAQNDINAQIEQEAQAYANAAVKKSTGEARGIELVAEAQANSVKMISDAAAKSADNPTFIKLKELEVKTIQANKWNGQLPAQIWGSSNVDPAVGMGIILNPNAK